MDQKKKIIILGAGFGGIRAAILIVKQLRALQLLERYEVVLIDRNDHHTYTPLLYETATTSKDTADIAHLHAMVAHNATKLIGSLPIQFLRAEVELVDLMDGDVHLRPHLIMPSNPRCEKCSRMARRDEEISSHSYSSEEQRSQVGTQPQPKGIWPMSAMPASTCPRCTAAGTPSSALLGLTDIDSYRGRRHGEMGSDGTMLTWDYLIIALGSEINFFGIPGAQEHSLPLKTFADAIRIRNAIWNQLSAGNKEVKIAVGGGGPTGVEISGELIAWTGELKREFPGAHLSVEIVEAAPSILSGLDARVVSIVRARLLKLGVTITENAKIQNVAEHVVTLGDGKTVPFDLLLWTAGVKAPPIFGTMPLKMEARGRIEVPGEMTCLPQTPNLKLHEMIYALGDCVCFYDPITKKPMPSVARAALSQATVVAHNVVEDIKVQENPRYKPVHRIYHPMEYPYIIPAGGKYAVAKLGPFIISGFLGWVLKGLVELNYLLSVMPISYALMTWWHGLIAFMKNDRLG